MRGEVAILAVGIVGVFVSAWEKHVGLANTFTSGGPWFGFAAPVLVLVLLAWLSENHARRQDTEQNSKAEDTLWQKLGLFGAVLGANFVAAFFFWGEGQLSSAASGNGLSSLLGEIWSALGENRRDFLIYLSLIFVYSMILTSVAWYRLLTINRENFKLDSILEWIARGLWYLGLLLLLVGPFLLLANVVWPQPDGSTFLGIFQMTLWIAAIAAVILALLWGLRWIWAHPLLVALLAGLAAFALFHWGRLEANTVCELLPVCGWWPSLKLGSFSGFDLTAWPLWAMALILAAGTGIAAIAWGLARLRNPFLTAIAVLLGLVLMFFLGALLGRSTCGPDEIYDPKTNSCACAVAGVERAADASCTACSDEDQVFDEETRRCHEIIEYDPLPLPAVTYDFREADLGNAWWLCRSTQAVRDDKPQAWCKGNENEAYYLANRRHADLKEIISTASIDCDADLLIAVGSASAAGGERFDPDLSGRRTRALSDELAQKCPDTAIQEMDLGWAACPSALTKEGLCLEYDPDRDTDDRQITVIEVRASGEGPADSIRMRYAFEDWIGEERGVPYLLRRQHMGHFPKAGAIRTPVNPVGSSLPDSAVRD